MFTEFINATLETNQKLKNYIDNNLTKEDLMHQGDYGFGGDKSLNIDIKAEDMFLDSLLSYGDIYSEEKGLVKSNNKTKIKDVKIIIDPLDGSDNFVSGLKYYGTSVALQIDGITKVGIVYNLVDGSYVVKDENGVISRDKNLSTYAKLGIFERAYRFPEVCKKLSKNGIKFRSPGAVALSLAEAQRFKFVLFAGEMREFDLEAALYINNHLNIYKTNQFLLLSKNIEIFNEIKEIIKEE